ncbi:MAG: hypothetical protein IJX47_07070 [Clostridia bacterium]|nr:hypothetical protein [Clostridia bacterium]
MKKHISMILSVILALSLAVSMTSCDEDKSSSNNKDKEEGATLNGKTPEEAYNEALEAINSVDNFEMTSVQDIEMVMKYNGETINQDQNQTVIQRKNGDNGYAKVYGSTMEVETWYVDGVLYTISGDVKAKATLSLEEYAEQMMGESSDNLLNIPDSWFEGVEFKTDEDMKTLEFHIDGDEYMTMIGNLLDSMNLSADDVEISEVVYTVYFDEDGSIEKVINDFSMSFTMQGVEVAADYHTVTTVSIGTASAITVPAGGDSFIDVTDQM